MLEEEDIGDAGADDERFLLDKSEGDAPNAKVASNQLYLLDNFNDDSALAFGGPLLVLFSVYSFRFFENFSKYFINSNTCVSLIYLRNI